SIRSHSWARTPSWCPRIAPMPRPCPVRRLDRPEPTRPAVSGGRVQRHRSGPAAARPPRCPPAQRPCTRPLSPARLRPLATTELPESARAVVSDIRRLSLRHGGGRLLLLSEEKEDVLGGDTSDKPFPSPSANRRLEC